MQSEVPLHSVPSFKLYFPEEDVNLFKEYVSASLRSGMLTLGKFTQEFEKQCVAILGSKSCVAVNSGTSAIEIALRATGTNHGEVIVPTNTFGATAAAAIFADNHVKFADVDVKTLCASHETIESQITRSTKAVIIVHIAGIVTSDIDKVVELCRSKGITLIEDAAHAFGSRYNGKSAGSFGRAGCFSFYPTKVVTSGEGGLISTDELNIDKRSRILRDQGKESFNSNNIVELGYNWRMSEFNAAAGLIAIRRIEQVIAQRNHIAAIYDEKLNRCKNLESIKPPPGCLNNYYKYVVLLKPEINREEFKKRIKAKGVSCSGEVYSPPLHLQPAFQKQLGKTGEFPNAEDVCSRMVCLPMFQYINDEVASYVAESAAHVADSLS